MTSMTKVRKIGGILSAISAFVAFTPARGLSCGADEDLPGALPPAPHGGDTAQLKEEAIGGLKTEEASEKEAGPTYHWEGIYDKDRKEIQLYLLTVQKEGAAVFSRLSPEQELSKLEIKIELPRENKTISLPFSVDSEKVAIKFEPGKLNRYLVHVSASHAGKLKTAKIQIEEE